MRNGFSLHLILASCIILIFALPGCGRTDAPKPGAVSGVKSKKQLYHCPMHPTYISERPGDCPICNMKLVPITDDTQQDTKSSAPSADSVKTGQFYCPMHPEVVRGKPGVCPKCNMDLVEKKASDPSNEPSGATGRVSIMLSPEKRQKIGLKTEKAAKRDLSAVVRSTALVEHDETRFARISPRFNGWIRSLKVNFTGAPVKKGEPLFVAYSPALLISEREYLLVLSNYENLKNDPDEDQRKSAKHLLESAKKKLVLLELGDEEIKSLEKNRTPSDEMLFRAPFSGHVTGKSAVEGKAFAAGETLFEIADLSHLWVRGAVFEYEMPLIKVGQEAVVNFPYLQKSFPSKITFIYPHIDPRTRRGEIRLELDNPGHLLRPNMWANAEIRIPLGEKLALPSGAVIDTGKRFIAFVDAGNGHIEPRELKVGAKTDEYYEILEGVAEGENVVTRALFLVDSESQLKSAIAGMGTGHEGHKPDTGKNVTDKNNSNSGH